MNVAEYDKAEKWRSERASEGIQTGVEKYACSRDCTPCRLVHRCESGERDATSVDDGGGGAFGARRREFARQTTCALSISNGQQRRLVAPTKTTPAEVEVLEMTVEMRIGASSLQIRSMRRMTALRWVRLYVVLRSVPASARTGTQSRSMESVFAAPLSLSTMPIVMRMVKRGIRRVGMGGPARRMDQPAQATMTVPRLKEMLRSNGLRRLRELSIAAPIELEAINMANVVMKPLVRM